MKTYISLLRGINVSGQKMINMKELKALLESVGLKEMVTYIQSGNLVFKSSDPNPDSVSVSIQSAIKGKYGFVVPVLTKTLAEINAAIVKNPFKENPEVDEKQLYVTFLSGLPKQENIDNLKESEFYPDAFAVIGKEVYLNCSNGYGKTKLDNNFFERKLKVSATTRNWNTVNKLSEIAATLK